MRNEKERMFHELIERYIGTYVEVEQAAVRDILNDLAQKNNCEMIYWYIWNLGKQDIFEYRGLLFSAAYQSKCATISVIARELYNHYEEITDELKQKLMEPKTNSHPYTPATLRVKRQIEKIQQTQYKEPKVEVIVIPAPVKRSERSDNWRENLTRGVQGLLSMDIYADDEEETE